MDIVVLILAAVQAGVGGVLLMRWARGGRRGAGKILTHVGCNLAAIVLWAGFILPGGSALAWTSFAALTVGNAVGDAMLIARARARNGASESFPAGYRDAVVAVFRGRMPGHVTFHALFSGVVYFTMLGVCIGASVAEASG